MIDKRVYELDYIRELQKKYVSDPGLIERALYAFGLLEAIKSVGMPFCFKGGTSLMLILEKPARLSTDIDILVEPGTDVGDYIDKASRIFPFLNKEEDIRKGKNGIVKRHFKFTYFSPVTHAISFNPSNVGKCSPTYAIAKKIPSAAGLSPDADGIASINTIQFKCQMSFDFWSKSPFIQKSVRAAFASPLAEIPCQMHQHPHPSHNNPGVSDILR